MDLEGGIKNALERGSSIEDAVQSFLNAGYSEQEVKEAADKVNPSVLSQISPLEKKSPSQTLTPPRYSPPPSPKLKPEPAMIQSNIVQKKSSGLLIFLIFILIILLGTLAVSIIFQDQITEFLKGVL